MNDNTEAAGRDLDLSVVAELERYPANVRARCAAIAESIATVDESDWIGAQTRVERVRSLLAERHQLTLSDRQVYRYLARYRQSGIAGLADRRSVTTRRESRTDVRVFELIEAELKALETASTGTRSRTITRVRWEAARQQISLPSDRTLYRLIDQLDRRRGSFDNATTRRSKAVRPDRTLSIWTLQRH